MAILKVKDKDGNVFEIPVLAGEKGDPGKDGHTPVAGKDYFTETEKAEFVQAVLAALPVYNGEVVKE